LKKSTDIFLWIAAACSLLGAVTTALLIFLPISEAVDFESRVMLHADSFYMARHWILFLHPQFNFIASLGIAYLLIMRFPWQMILGTVFLFIWAYTEMSQQALLIDSLNQIWRPGHFMALDEMSRFEYKVLISAAEGISDSKYFLLLYGFGLGSLLYGLAMIFLKGLGRAIGIGLIFIGILSLTAFTLYYMGFQSAEGIVYWSYQWIYPYLQPLVRIGIGVWIGLNIIRLRSDVSSQTSEVSY
jgi:hypothetical protein